MRPWQLYLDESGDFDQPSEAVLVAGVLFEGRALPQHSIAVRQRIASIFVGSAYPPHAAHHNVASSLLCEALAGRAPKGPAAIRFSRAIERALAIARESGSHEAQQLRDAVALGEERLRVALDPIRSFDAWLSRCAPEAHQALVQERDAQRVDLARFTANGLANQLGSTPRVVAAWQRESDASSNADARYEVLYATLLERALSFATSRGGAELHVHLAERAREPAAAHIAGLNQAEAVACAFSLLRREPTPHRVVRFSAETYDARVAPGVVLADFASNTLRSAAFSASSWSQLHGSLTDRVGLVAEAHSALLPLTAALPGVAAEGPLRDAIRRAAEGLPVPPLSGPRWAREQAASWITAITGEGAR